MEFLPFILVLASAVSHASWNFLAKGTSNKQICMWLMTSTSLLTLLPVYFLLLSDWRLPLAAIPYLIVSGAAETGYFLTLGKAYELEDLSVVYPLARSSPLFLTFFAVLFLREEISRWGTLGILLMVFGVYTLHLKSLSLKDFMMPLKSLRGRASQFALLTALFTSIYSMSDKLGVTYVNPILYSFWLEFFILPMLTIAVLWKSGWKTIVKEWRDSKISVTIGGFLMRFGYLLVLFAMSLAQVSYILALRQISVVIGSLSGVVFLHEKYGKVRVVSSIIMFFGVYILAVLT